MIQFASWIHTEGIQFGTCRKTRNSVTPSLFSPGMRFHVSAPSARLTLEVGSQTVFRTKELIEPKTDVEMILFLFKCFFKYVSVLIRFLMIFANRLNYCHFIQLFGLTLNRRACLCGISKPGRKFLKVNRELQTISFWRLIPNHRNQKKYVVNGWFKRPTIAKQPPNEQTGIIHQWWNINFNYYKWFILAIESFT